jgi:hypothetical protein
VKKILKIVLVLVAVVLVGAQFVRADRTNPPIDPTHVLRTPPDVQPILDRACADCHSNNTKWPWYTNVAPVSWWIADHVHEGRHELNFSEFNTYPPKKAAHKMEEVCEVLEKGEMPMPDYLRLHAEAKLTAAEKQRLCDWAKGEEKRLKALR